jgi:S1-C subfamily serine protease
VLSIEWLNAVAPVGSLQSGNEWVATGAGVFVSAPPLVWVVTANHVVEAVGADSISVVVNRASGDSVTVVELSKILALHNLSWVRDPANDLAAAPMPLSPEYQIKAIGQDLCLLLEHLIPSMPCYSIGCPYGLRGVDSQSSIPIVLDGVVAGVERAAKRIFTSIPTFPGNSGGPLIVIRSPFNPGGTIIAGQPTVLFAGIMLQSAVMHAPVATAETPSLHLGVAVPADLVLNLLNSDEARKVADVISKAAMPS